MSKKKQPSPFSRKLSRFWGTLSADSQDAAYSRTFRRRTVVFGLAIVVLIIALIIRLTFVQLVEGPAIAQDAIQMRTVDYTVQALRGTITDVNGVVMAQSQQRYTIYADQNGARNFQPKKCTGDNKAICHSLDGKPVPGSGPGAVAKMLAPVLKMNVMELGAKLAGVNSYIVLKKNVTPATKRAVDNLHLSGVIGSELTVTRSYPSGATAGAIIGGVNNDDVGVAGVEKMSQDSLKGENGKQVYQRGESGEKIPGTESVTKPAKNGGKVRLTIDRDVQWFVEKSLQDQENKIHAQWGIVVVQEVKTGRILAVADTNQYSAGGPDAILKGSLSMTATFEPGSVGKLITSSGLIQEGFAKGSSRYTVPYSFVYQGQTYHDAVYHPVERLTLAGIINESSNVGMVKSAEKYPVNLRYEYLKKFGIGEPTGIDFPGISSGVLSPASSWDDRTRQTILFGQGYTVNALQLTNIVATIANGGVRMGQSLVASSTDQEGRDTTPQPHAPTRVISKSTSEDMMDMMESVMDEEYANVFKVNGYRLAGKTGTAEVVGSKGGLTQIVGDSSVVIPADDPRFVITVAFMDSSQHGGYATSPVTNPIGEFLMQKYKVPQSTPRKNAISTTW